MDTTILAGIAILGVIAVIVIFLWKTQRREHAFAEDEDEEGARERVSFSRVFRCPNCETEVDWETPECPECGIIFEEDSFVCPRCNAPANPADLECEKCGLVFLEEAFVCPNCKHAVEPDATKCDRCKESFWSPLKLPARGQDIMKVEKEGRGGKDGGDDEDGDGR